MLCHSPPNAHVFSDSPGILKVNRVHYKKFSIVDCKKMISIKGISSINISTERKAWWKNGGDLEIRRHASSNFARFCDPYFRNKPLALSTNKDFRYLNSNIFMDRIPLNLFYETRKQLQAVPRIAGSCLGPCDQTLHL